MRFAPFLLLAFLAAASPIADTTTEVTDLADAEVGTSLNELTPITDILDKTNSLEARGSTPGHNCKCFNGYITDENYSGVYKKTLAYSDNFADAAYIRQGTGVYFLGPSKYFLVVEVRGKNSQLLTKDRVGNIIHQLKVARGDKEVLSSPRLGVISQGNCRWGSIIYYRNRMGRELGQADVSHAIWLTG
jgi:hypothetical protein